MKMYIVIAACCGLILSACKDAQITPKPRAYPRIEFPERGYTSYDDPACPFTFRYPSYAEIKLKDQPCWFDIFMPGFNARIHCSYIHVRDEAHYEDLVQDAFVIATKINERANYMEEKPFHNPQGVGGLTLSWTGPAASPIHFFMTDTTTHFFKAALYFDSKVQVDSLAPITAFIKSDIDTLIHSFSWK